MRPALRALAVAALLTVLAPVASAAANPVVVDPWVQLTQGAGHTTDEVSGVRATDGTLRLVYVDESTPLVAALRTRVLSSRGVLGAYRTIEDGWSSIRQPDIEFVSGTIPTVFWGGVRTTDASDPASSGQAWASAFNGATWSRSAAPVTTSTSASASSQVSTAIDATGQPWLTWTGAGLLDTHAGLTTTGPERNLSDGCCQYGSNLVRDARTGALTLVYFSNQGGQVGTWIRPVSPTLTAPTKLVGSATGTSAMGRTTRLPATAREGGGVYTAYCASFPSCTTIRVTGDTGKSLSYTVPGGAGSNVWTAAGPGGRLWLLWNRGATVWAVRSNTAFTKWGTPVDAGAPLRTTDVWNLYGNGTFGPLDVLANSTTRGAIHQFHRRVLPGLTIKPPVGVRAGGLTVIRVYIRDAGSGVRGSVTLRGVTHTTDANGRATFVLPPSTRAGSYPITARSTGYTPGTGTLRVAR